MKGLLITYFYPPANTIASHRVYSFAKYLNTENDTLDVLCADWEGDLALSTANEKIFKTSKRAFDPGFGEIKSSGIRHLKKIILNNVLKVNYLRGRKPSLFYKEVMNLIKKMDMSQYEYILTSYAPLDCIHIGAAVKKQFPHIKWIIDYRDVYSLLEYNHYGWSKFIFKRFEKKLTSGADGFITVSETLKTMQSHLLQKKGTVIYNGFDDLPIDDDTAFKTGLQGLTLPLISHVGSLYKGERNVEPLLHHLHACGLDQKFMTVFAIMSDLDETYLKNVIQKTGVENVKIFRNLSFQNSLTLQRQSAYLLLLTNTDGSANGYLTGKLFEYMSMYKPIIYSGSTKTDFELYQIIKKYGLGEHFSKTDYDSYKRPLDRMDISFFHRKNQADRLREFIKSILEN